MERRRDLTSKEHQSMQGLCVLPNQGWSPGCSGSLGHSADCGKDQGRRVLGSPSDAGRLPPSPGGCGLSGACSGLAGRLEGEVSRGKQQRYTTAACPQDATLEPPPGKAVGTVALGKTPRGGVLTEVFNGLDVIVAEVQSVQFLQRL